VIYGILKLFGLIILNINWINIYVNYSRASKHVPNIKTTTGFIKNQKTSLSF
jgi:hypothetical protein